MTIWRFSTPNSYPGCPSIVFLAFNFNSKIIGDNTVHGIGSNEGNNMHARVFWCYRMSFPFLFFFFFKRAKIHYIWFSNLITDECKSTVSNLLKHESGLVRNILLHNNVWLVKVTFLEEGVRKLLKKTFSKSSHKHNNHNKHDKTAAIKSAGAELAQLHHCHF